MLPWTPWPTSITPIPARYRSEIRGELDWIVMKSLEKDRTRRYESANELAKDVQRYLDDEAVEACPPSALYRFRKFAKRNRVPLAIVGFIAAAIVLIAVSIQARMAMRDAQTARLQEQQRRLEAEKAYEATRLDKLVEEGLRLASYPQLDFPAATARFDEVLASRPDDAAVLLYRGRTYYQSNRPREALHDLERALELSPRDNLAAHQLLAVVAQQLGNAGDAKQHLALVQEANPDTVEALTTQALALNNRQGIELLTKAIEKQPFDPTLYRHRGQLAINVAVRESKSTELIQLAFSDLEKSLKAFPDDSSVLQPLCQILHLFWVGYQRRGTEGAVQGIDRRLARGVAQ